jgi:ribose transport system substrate-binding protein
MKKILLGLAAIGLSAMFMGCGAKEDESPKIALLMSNRSNEFFSVLENSAIEKANELGYKVEVYDASNDATKQPGQIEDAIAKGVDAIIINPLNEDATKSVLNDATDRNIPIITVDTTVKGVDLLAEIATDNEDGGKFAAEWITKLSGIKANDISGIIHMRGIDGHTAHITRYKGFKDYLLSQEAGSEWNVIANDNNHYIELTGNFAQDNAQNALEAKLSALEPNGKYIIYAENDVMAIGCIGAIENDSRFNIDNFSIIGFDGSNEGKNLVDQGKMVITVVQDFKFIGKESVVVADNFLKNDQKPEKSVIPIEVVMYPEDQNPRK